MTLSSLLALRPKEPTVAAITASLANARAQMEAVKGKISQMEADRPRLLVDGTEAEIAAAERELEAKQREIEQLGAFIVGLEPKLETARKTQSLDELRQAVEAANAKSAQFMERWRERYSDLAEQIASLLRLEQEAMEAVGRAKLLREHFAKEVDVSKIPQPRLPVEGVRAAKAVPEINPETNWLVRSMGELVRLPSADGSLRDGFGTEPVIWVPVPRGRRS